MARNHWHILHDDGALTVARRVPVRFDLAVSTRLPMGRKLRLAQQVRQDLWRLLRGLRGFAPVVRVEEQSGGLLLTAGGQVDGDWPAETESQIAALLACPARRARWLRWAA
ncbi:hypothetical protein EI983_05655 [Roseovarius faecimaris]|uniref:Uncharacterized protein n=1 Tax=Roseovarius faecimaris TaxID=2494550 RepID=A0A6I6ILI8_9RHOB|nr:hypothetical protein [Roseovarius faecimaris]QGX97789.1 hypothetical protein EI983_05655 [Roseovarius faecimaris]